MQSMVNFWVFLSRRQSNIIIYIHPRSSIKLSTLVFLSNREKATKLLNNKSTITWNLHSFVCRIDNFVVVEKYFIFFPVFLLFVRHNKQHSQDILLQCTIARYSIHSSTNASHSQAHFNKVGRFLGWYNRRLLQHTQRNFFIYSVRLPTRAQFSSEKIARMHK